MLTEVPAVRRIKHGPLLAGLIPTGEQEFEDRNEEWPGDPG